VGHYDLRTSAGADAGIVKLKFGDHYSSWAAWTAAAVSGTAVLGFIRGWVPHVAAPAVQASIETVIAIAATTTAVLLVSQYRRRHQMYSLLLLGAVLTVALTDLVFSVVPALLDIEGGVADTGAATVSGALVAVAFLLVAFCGDRMTGGRQRRPWQGLAIGAGCIAIAAAGEVIGLVLGGSGIASSSSAATRGLGVLEAVILVIAGVRFVREAPAATTGGAMMGAAAFLLAGARLQAIAMPVVAAGWITPRELLRLGAYGLLLAAAVGDELRIRRAAQADALFAQREEIARDLHDGLAQDLAVIAFQAQRLEAELGPLHPLAIAARRALSASRQSIVDLSASHAPSTAAALREVADELEATLGVEITVHDEVDRSAGLEPDLGARAREHFVRIAREAVVNAARHGHAHHVDVTLASHGRGWLLTVADDGSGIAESQLASPSGFGLQAIRARAEELGGRLSAARGVAGGTVVQLSTAGAAEAGAQGHPQP
jgi:signal transduction histidine kinase